MLHHISLGVADLERAGAFYDAVMSPLGFERVWSDATAIGYGLQQHEDKLAIKLRGRDASPPGAGFHLALAAPSRQAVDAFHEAALRCGGQDNGAPGLRPDYGPDYYAAFVVDPDGHRIEAVINAPQAAATQGAATSVRYEVLVDGQRVAVTGIEEFGVLTTIVSWVRRNPAAITDTMRAQEHFDEVRFLRETCELELTGLDSTEQKHHQWARVALHPGSEVTIRILAPGEFDAPKNSMGRIAR
jgi:catechol 2,3-dioxygenase-like lactoylglutathione lyase family enzyme